METAIGNMLTNELSSSKTLLKHAAGWIWPKGHTLPTTWSRVI